MIEFNYFVVRGIGVLVLFFDFEVGRFFLFSSGLVVEKYKYNFFLNISLIF